MLRLFISFCQNSYRMDCLGIRAMLNLHAAGTAITDNLVIVITIDGIKQLLPHLHGGFIIVLVEAVAAGNTAAACVSIDDIQPGLFQQVKSRQPDPVPTARKL